MQILFTIISIIASVILAIISNTIATMIQPHLEKRKKLLFSLFVGSFSFVVLTAILLQYSAKSEDVTGLMADNDFDYQVRVLSEENNNAIRDAKVIVELQGGRLPIDEYTDTNGFTVVTINASHNGKRGRLTVEAQGYEPFIQNVTFDQGALPEVIQLKPRQ